MPGCYGVKFLLQSIWLKIEIWDLQGMYINGMNLVFLDPDNPLHKFVKTCRGRGAALGPLTLDAWFDTDR